MTLHFEGSPASLEIIQQMLLNNSKNVSNSLSFIAERCLLIPRATIIGKMPAELCLDEKEALTQFRELVADILEPEHNDTFLMRWLSARYWVPQDAEKMLRESIKWRREFDIDNITNNWTIPDVVLQYVPLNFFGYDKAGNPIIIFCNGNVDIMGLLHCLDVRDFRKILMVYLEKYLALAKKNNLQQLTVIIDFENFSIKPYLSKFVADVLIESIQRFEANYPDVLKVCYIINAPKVFSIFYNLIKNFLHENTIKILQIYKNDPPEWQKAILRGIDPQNLPKHYGGTRTDPDGNPRCPSLLVPGGPIPEELYKVNVFQASKSYTSVVILNRDKLKIKLDVKEKGSFIKYDFYVEENDIKFKIVYKEKGKSKAVVPEKRIGEHQETEYGMVECKVPATYIVTFDNSYSIFKTKRIFYEVSIEPPITDI